MSKRTLTALALALLTNSSCVFAQGWSVEGQAGRIRSSLDAAGTVAQTLALGLRFEDLNTGFAFSVGVPTENDPLWGALAGTHRAAIQRSAFVAGVDLTGSAYAMHDRGERRREITSVIGPPRIITEPGITGRALAGQALPLIGFEGKRLQFHARTGPSFYTSKFGQAERNRFVLLSDLQLTFLPSAATAILPVVRRFTSDSSAHTYAGISAVAANHAGSIWASAGRWPGLDSVGTSWAAGATWKLRQRASLSVSARHDAFDALYLNARQTSWNVGISVQLSRPSPLVAPVPAEYVDGRATIRLDATHAKAPPMIAGDFTNWKPQPMQRQRNTWTYTVNVAPGVYKYAFVDEHGEWFVPKDYPGRKDDGMGGSVAVLVVQ